MVRSSMPAIDRAEDTVHDWVNELGDYLDWSNDHRTYGLLRATLHAIRDFLPIDESADLAAQLPVLVRGIYYDGWRPAEVPARPRNFEAFIARVLDEFPADHLERPEVAVAAVVKLLNRHVSPGEMAQVRQSMRKDLHFLFPDA